MEREIILWNLQRIINIRLLLLFCLQYFVVDCWGVNMGKKERIEQLKWYIEHYVGCCFGTVYEWKQELKILEEDANECK